MRISQAHWDELLAHAREDAPNECCGLVWAADGEIVGLERASNERNSPYGFELDSRSLLKANELDEEFQVGIYHSHPRSPAEPSQTDINLAFYPEALYVIVGLKDAEPDVRAFAIVDGQVSERSLELIP